MEYRFTNRLPAQQQHIQRRTLRLLRFGGRDGDPVAGPEDRELPLVNRVADRSDRTLDRTTRTPAR